MLAGSGLYSDWVGEIHALCWEIGALGALHFWAPPHAQAKLIRLTRGIILDAAADTRRGSPTFGHKVTAAICSVA